MSIRGYRIIIAMSLLFVGSPSYGQSPSCYDPMEVPGTCLPWGYVDLQQQMGGRLPVDISKDGSAVAAVVSPGFGVARWRLDTGLDVYTPPPGFTNPFLNIEAPVLSADGAFIAGRGVFSSALLVGRIFRWEVANGTTIILPIGPTPHPTVSGAQVRPERNAAISADGQTIVGRGTALNSSGTAFDAFWPFLWTNSGGPDGSTDGNSSQAFTGNFVPVTIDGFGFRVAGSERLSGNSGAVFWHLPGVGTSIGPNPESSSRAISYDGQTIAGQRSDGGVERAFRWTQGTGPVDIPHRFVPRSVSDDGLLISGRDADTGLPTVWTISNGYRSLAEHLGDFGISFAPPTATSTPLSVASGDGSVFVVLGEKWVSNARPVNYVSLGDSFSSGEGVPPYADTNNDCHRSEIAYSSLAKPRSSIKTLRGLGDPETGTEQPGFTWSFVACSGAVTNNVRAAGEGQYPGTADATPQLAQGVVDSATDLVTISIGGNDARFNKVAKACLWKSDCRNTEAAGVSGVTWAEFLPTHINTTVRQAVKATYQEIKTAAPNAAVVALGYPLLVSGIECSDLNISSDRGFSAEEQAFVRQMADLLNEVMEDAAREAGIHFLGDEVATKFSPHEICDVGANPWLHGVVLQPSVHSLHPNQAGQAAYAAVVNEFLNRTGIDYANGFFASGLPRNPPPQF